MDEQFEIWLWQRPGEARRQVRVGRSRATARSASRRRPAPVARPPPVRQPAASDRPRSPCSPSTTCRAIRAPKSIADGIVEEITSSLSRIRDFTVIARNSAYAYKGRARDVRADLARARRALRPGRKPAQGRRPGAHHGPAHRRRDRRPHLGRPLQRRRQQHLRLRGRDRRARRRRAAPVDPRGGDRPRQAQAAGKPCRL